MSAYNKIIKSTIASLKDSKEWKSATKDDRKALQDLSTDAAQLAYLLAKYPQRANELRNEVAVFRSRFMLIKATALKSVADHIIRIAVTVVRKIIGISPAAKVAMETAGLILSEV